MKRAVLLFSLIVAATSMFAQTGTVAEQKSRTKDSEGKEFWLCFMRNYREVADATARDQLTLQLFFTSNENARVRIEIEGLSYQRTLLVVGGTVATLVIDEHAQLNAVATPQRLSIHITSDVPIAVYGLNRRYQTTDTYLALPVSVLGKEYRAMCYSNLSQDLVSQIAVVATEDNTVLTITPRCGVMGGYSADRPYTMRMQKGEAYQIIADFLAPGSGDLTGTLIRSTAPVSVFSGHSCAYVPNGVQACNHLVEQLPPVQSWGKHFYVGMLKGRSRSTVRVVAHEERTRVFEDGKLVAVLSSGDFYEMVNVRKHMQVTADKPILVAQFSQGFKNGDSIGDPMMIMVSPTQQFVRKYRVATPVNGQWDHFLNVVVPTDKISTMVLDGSPIPVFKFESFGLSRFSIAQIQVDYGTHVITGGAPFGLYSYGSGYGDDGFDAYGNMGGQSFFDLENSRDTVAPVPELSSPFTGQVIVRDDRNTDKGLRSISVISSSGFSTSIPTPEEGAPHALLSFRPVNPRESAGARVTATDMAGNSFSFSLCYIPDAHTGAGTFEIGNEVQPCYQRRMWSASSFFTAGFIRHDADFGTTNDISARGRFSSAQGSGGIFGVALSREMDADWQLGTRLALETYGGVLRAPDSIVTRVRDSSGAIRNFQEERTLSLRSPSLALSFLGTYRVVANAYVYGGPKAIIAMGRSVDVQQRIIQPANAYYTDTGSPSRSLDIDVCSAIKTLRFALITGAGCNIPINPLFGVFAEIEYVHPLDDILSKSDGTWRISAIEAHIGARIRF